MHASPELGALRIQFCVSRHPSGSLGKRSLIVSALCLFACVSEPPSSPDIPAAVSEPDALEDVTREALGDADVSEPEFSCGPEPAPDFDDHTLSRFDSVSSFFTFVESEDSTVSEGSPIQVKFVMTDFSELGGPSYYLDPDFYTLHDEWYWFRLLNGVEIPCLDVASEDYSFASIDEVYDAFLPLRGQGASALPLDLRFSQDGRLYSPHFYEIGLYDASRFLGLGALLYYAPNADRLLPEALWLFELQYGDESTEEEVLRFYERLKASLPDEIAQALRWLARSDFQETLGAALSGPGGPLAGKVVSYQDLVVSGGVIAYNEGIVAGRIQRIEKGTLSTASLAPDDILVLDEVPDYLPPVAAIVTAVPQTPLAHLNLLAKSRGTPNVHLAGVMEDLSLKTWAYYKRPVILQVREDAVTWEELSDAEYALYREKLRGPEMRIPQLDLSDAPFFVDLREGGLAELAERTPLTGGKAAAMAAFNDFPEIRTPSTPLAVTIRAYAEHLASFDGVLNALLADPRFEESSRVRFVVLEGEEDFREEHTGDDDAIAWLDDFLSEQGAESLLGSLVSAGGLKRVIRDHPLDSAFKALVTETLSAHFQALSPLQGLRFRSSSTAEDIQGFNGAGLYDSNTGYLDPSLQSQEKLQDRDIAWALKKTWASYWGFEALEERRAAGIDHLSGRMGVLVHPRFDDALESANAVATLYLAREPGGARLEMVVNAQKGALSVTNPDPEAPTLPEIAMLSAQGGGEPTVTYLQGSSELPQDQRVLSVDELRWLFEALSPLTHAWLDTVNSALALAQRRSTLVLDFEIKRMKEGWPALRSGDASPEGLVLKQVRTLDSPIPPLDDAVLSDSVPRDILEQVVGVTRRRCQAGSLMVETLDYTTDPAKGWALDYALSPFSSGVSVSVSDSEDSGGLEVGAAATLSHLDATITHPGMAEGGPWSLKVVFHDAAGALGISQLDLVEGGDWSWRLGDETYEGQGLVCSAEALHEGPQAYLTSLLSQGSTD